VMCGEVIENLVTTGKIKGKRTDTEEKRKIDKEKRSWMAFIDG
jgi:hypothetical protein